MRANRTCSRPERFHLVHIGRQQVGLEKGLGSRINSTLRLFVAGRCSSQQPMNAATRPRGRFPCGFKSTRGFPRRTRRRRCGWCGAKSESRRRCSGCASPSRLTLSSRCVLVCQRSLLISGRTGEGSRSPPPPPKKQRSSDALDTTDAVRKKAPTLRHVGQEIYLLGDARSWIFLLLYPNRNRLLFILLEVDVDLCIAG